MTTREIFAIILALREEKSVYDKKHHLLYMPDVAGEPLKWYGLQVFHIADRPDLPELLKKHDGITQYCLGCIPAPGACQNPEDEYGWSEWEPFDDSYEEDTNEYYLLSALLEFAYHKFANRDADEIEIRED